MAEAANGTSDRSPTFWQFIQWIVGVVIIGAIGALASPLYGERQSERESAQFVLQRRLDLFQAFESAIYRLSDSVYAEKVKEVDYNTILTESRPHFPGEQQIAQTRLRLATEALEVAKRDLQSAHLKYLVAIGGTKSLFQLDKNTELDPDDKVRNVLASVPINVPTFPSPLTRDQVYARAEAYRNKTKASLKKMYDNLTIADEALCDRVGRQLQPTLERLENDSLGRSSDAYADPANSNAHAR